MDQARIIAEVAQRNGVLLDRDDPILTISTMLEMHAADQQERDARIAEVLAEVRDVVEKAQQPLTAKDVKALHRSVRNNAALDLADAVERLVIQRYRTLVIATVASLLCSFAAGAGLMAWWVH